MIPISAVRFGRDEEDLVRSVIRSGRVAQGALVQQFENEFAAQFGVGHAVAVSNGTVALVAALQVIGLQPGDEVITTPFTFVATVNAILEAGAVAVLADIEPGGFTIDPQSIRALITPRTRAIVPVHLYGQTADLNEIAAIAAEYGLRVIEDAAQAHGATHDGRAAGALDLATFSFYATKNISTGEGGMVVTDSAADADRLRVLRNQGMRARYEYELAGHNYRMTELQAALGIPQLARYDEVVAIRSHNARVLTEALQPLAGVVTPVVLPGRRHVWHQYTVRIAPTLGISRDEFAAELGRRGVATGIYYPRCLSEYDFYRTNPRVVASAAPHAMAAAREALSLPVHQWLSADDLDEIVAAVAEVAGRHAGDARDARRALEAHQCDDGRDVYPQSATASAAHHAGAVA